MNKPKQTLPAGHVVIPALAIGSLSLVLAVGLNALGIPARLNALVARWASSVQSPSFPKELPDWAVWLAALVFALALPLAMLGVTGNWRRWVVWITTLVLVAGWAPVLTLAARAPDVATPFIVALWSGICALVYASRHRMESDRAPNPPPASPS